MPSLRSSLRASLFAAALASTTAYVAHGGRHQRIFLGSPSKNIQRFVEDYMTVITPRQTLHIKDTIDEAVEKLVRLDGTTGAPVVDDDHLLVGFVSVLDILPREAASGGALLPIIMEQFDDTSDGASPKEISQIYSEVQAARKVIARQVEDLMSTDVKTIKPHDTLQSAAGLMTTHQLHRLPVVDDDGMLLGTLASTDVMRDVVQKVRALAAHVDVDEDAASDLNP